MQEKRKITPEKYNNKSPPGWYYNSIRENIFQRFWHRKRFEEISKLITPVKGKVLDIGCADGVFTKIILEKTKASQIFGIDTSKTSIIWARRHWRKQKRIVFLTEDIHNLPFKTDSFSAVFALEVLEHISKPEIALKEIGRVLKKDGYALFLVPTESILFKLVWFLWHYSGRMVWKHTHIQ